MPFNTNGNLTSLIYPGGKTVTYGYDKANRLTTVTDWAYRETSYDYDANGRLVKTTRPNGSIMTIGYDAAGQMVWQNDVDSAGSGISRYEFTYDAMGNITVEESVYGNQYTLNNDYDAVYQILGQEKLDGLGGTVSQHSFGYDPGGNMTTAEEVYGQSETVMTYTYDNRLATFNSQNVTYDADGNMTYGPLGGVMVTFNQDARNRLTGVGDFSYIYDALNNRISATETVYGAAYSINYVINPNSALSQTLIKTDPDGTKTFYIYGLGLIGEETDGVYRSYHYDFRGSTVALTDSDGHVIDRYSYGPYGELLSHTGSSQTPFLYNGRDGVMTDDNGLYFMRARYYNLEIKRFISEDSFDRKYDDILKINLFEYANNDPVNRIDPSGYDSYVFYGLQHGSEGGFEKQAKSEAARLKKQYGTEVHLKAIETEEQFKNVWNGMGTYKDKDGNTVTVSIEGVSLLFHSNPHNLMLDYTKEEYITTFSNGKTRGTVNSADALWIGSLDKKTMDKITMDKITLLTCNGGHLDHLDDNLAVTFLNHNDVNKVVAWDGSLSYSNWFGTYYPRLAYNQKAFKSWAPYSSFLGIKYKRAPLGEITFTNDNYGKVNWDFIPQF